MTKSERFLALIIFVLGMIICMSVIAPRPETLLEVYTTKDIYYINGLHVTSESSDLDITFDDRLHLANWISERTADESEIPDWEVVNLLYNCTVITEYLSGEIAVSITNPYTDVDQAILFNQVDTLPDCLVRYFQD